MNSSQDQTAILLKKIEHQDDLIQKLRSEQSKLTTYIKEFKETLQKKIHKNDPNSSRATVDEDKLERQMEKQLENAKAMFKNYQNELKALQKKASKNNFTADSLLDMEVEIKKKENYIRELNDDIKNLNIVRRKQEKLIEKKQKNQDGAKLSKLVEQIRKQREVLDSLKAKHQQKQGALQKRKQAISEMEAQYIEKCKTLRQKPLSFEEFKEKRVQKRRDQSVHKVHSDHKRQVKKPSTIKEIINSHLDFQSIQVSEKSLNDLKEKKTVAQNSLKISKKKYEKQIEELQQRLDQLKAQNSNLNTKYLEKKKQKQLLQTPQTVNFKRTSSKKIKNLDPIK